MVTVKEKATMSLLKVLLSQAREAEDHKVTVDETFLKTLNDTLSSLLKEKEKSTK